MRFFSNRPFKKAMMIACTAALGFNAQTAYAQALHEEFIQSPDADGQAQGATIMDAASQSMNVEINKGRLVRLSRPASDVFLANPDIADIQVKSPKLVYIFGLRRGETSFYALDEQDNIIYSSNIQVTQSLTDLREAYDRLLPDATIDVSMMGKMVLLKGYVGSPDQAASAQSLAEQIVGREQLVNQITVLQPTQVNLRVRFAEVSRTVLKELGVNWQTFYRDSDISFGVQQGRTFFQDGLNEATQVPTRFFNQSSTASTLTGGVISDSLDLNFAIDALDDEGFLTVLAEPTLTAITGESANFLAGGEFPIPIPSRDGLGIEYREFGVRLEFTPTVMNSGRINMRVAPEVSDLTTAGAVQIDGFNIPSLSTRKAETTVELGSGQSFVIAGLLQNRTTQEANKFPGLGDIPILGALFRSENFRREETELLIVVTPYLVRPVSEGKLSLPTDGFVAPGDIDRFLGDRRWKARSAEPATAADSANGPSIKKRAGFQINDDE